MQIVKIIHYQNLHNKSIFILLMTEIITDIELAAEEF